MKKIGKVLSYALVAGIVALSPVLLVACGKDDAGNKNNTQQYHIYTLAQEAGYTGTYEEWLASIKGAKGEKGDQGIKGEQGLPGSDGREVEFRSTETHIQWRYKTADDSEEWKDLISLVELSKKSEPSFEGDVCSTVWKDEDGNVLYSVINHPLDSNPAYKGDIPEKLFPYEYPYLKYTFSGWRKNYKKSVNGNTVYTEYVPKFELTRATGDVYITVDDIKYLYDAENNYFIVKSYPYQSVVAIPSQIRGVKVGGIDVNTNDMYKEEVATLLLPNTLEDIKSIGNCPRLTNLVIPASVKRIESFAFSNSSGYRPLQNIEFEAGSQLEYIGQKAFIDSPIRRITIPASVKEIDTHAFENCIDLNTLSFEENSQLEIIRYAFINCTALQLVTLPESITRIDYEAFKGCSSLTEVTINSTKEVHIASNAFEGCNLTMVLTKIGSTVWGLDSYGFAKTGSVNGTHDKWEKA